MTTDNYTSPLSERYPSKEMQFLFFTRHEIQNLEKALDRFGRDGKRTGSFHHPGTD